MPHRMQSRMSHRTAGALVSVACSLACRAALPVLLYLYCRMPPRMPRPCVAAVSYSCMPRWCSCTVACSLACHAPVLLRCSGQRATRCWGQLTGTSPASFALGGSQAPGASQPCHPVVAARIQPTVSNRAPAHTPARNARTHARTLACTRAVDMARACAADIAFRSASPPAPQVAPGSAASGRAACYIPVV